MAKQSNILRQKADPRRRKPAVEDYPNDGPITIAGAYSELSAPAFGAWLRLLVEDVETLRRGRSACARILGKSVRRSNEILMELNRKGYVEFARGGPSRPTAIVINRRPLISARSGFVRTG